jgi:hypothetical protein
MLDTLTENLVRVRLCVYDFVAARSEPCQTHSTKAHSSGVVTWHLQLRALEELGWERTITDSNIDKALK